MIGMRVTDGEGTYAITGEQGGRYVLQRMDAFESPFQTTVAELVERFEVDEPEPTEPPDLVEGWKVLAAASADAAQRAALGVPEGVLPETVFRAAAGDKSAARIVAEDIAADPAKLEAWRTGTSTVHPGVDRDLRELTADV